MIQNLKGCRGKQGKWVVLKRHQQLNSSRVEIFSTTYWFVIRSPFKGTSLLLMHSHQTWKKILYLRSHWETPWWWSSESKPTLKWDYGWMAGWELKVPHVVEQCISASAVCGSTQQKVHILNMGQQTIR